jgi:predicted transcriptional regulator
VSEVGFMMDNETFQKFIGHFDELKGKIDGVTAVQEELKKDMKSEISAVKNGIENSTSDMKFEISAVKMTSRTA